MPEKKAPKRIEICGGIASGKTTLAHLLADGMDYGLTLEKFRENPFWKQFYENPQLFTIEKNICFLPQHTGGIKSWDSEKLLICDYAVFQDLAYASSCSTKGHLDVMRNIFDNLYHPLPPPTLIVHLLCKSKVQLERIRARGREEEKSITLEYLDSINKAIPDFLQDTLSTNTQVHEIHSDQINFATDLGARSELRETLLAIVGENLPK